VLLLDIGRGKGTKARRAREAQTLCDQLGTMVSLHDDGFLERAGALTKQIANRFDPSGLTAVSAVTGSVSYWNPY